MPSPRVFHPAAPEYHPEFGYFCPSPQLRRVLRVGVISAAVGAGAGALALLIVMPRGNSEAAHTENAPAAVAAAGQPAAAPELPAPASSPPATVTRPASSSVGLAQPTAKVDARPCTEQTWPYMASHCLAGAERKPEDLRVLRPEEPAQSAPAKVLPAKPRETAAAKSETEAKVPPKKKERAAHRSRDKRTRPPAEFDPRSTYATPYGTRYALPRRDWGWSW
jgi:hypothetical protein